MSAMVDTLRVSAPYWWLRQWEGERPTSVGRYDEELAPDAAVVAGGGDPAILTATADILRRARAMGVPRSVSVGPEVLLGPEGWTIAFVDGHGPRHCDRPCRVLSPDESRAWLDGGGPSVTARVQPW